MLKLKEVKISALNSKGDIGLSTFFVEVTQIQQKVALKLVGISYEIISKNPFQLMYKINNPKIDMLTYSQFMEGIRKVMQQQLNTILIDIDYKIELIK